MVGNHPIDVAAGRAAGTATVLVAATAADPTALVGNGLAPDLSVTHLGELVAVLDDGSGGDEHAGDAPGDAAQ